MASTSCPSEEFRYAALKKIVIFVLIFPAVPAPRHTDDVRLLVILSAAIDLYASLIGTCLIRWREIGKPQSSVMRRHGKESTGRFSSAIQRMHVYDRSIPMPPPQDPYWQIVKLSFFLELEDPTNPVLLQELDKDFNSFMDFLNHWWPVTKGMLAAYPPHRWIEQGIFQEALRFIGVNPHQQPESVAQPPLQTHDGNEVLVRIFLIIIIYLLLLSINFVIYSFFCLTAASC